MSRVSENIESAFNTAALNLPWRASAANHFNCFSRNDSARSDASLASALA